jgi:molecular chaperone DnaK
MTRRWALGIDLGTTNSTAVIFDGEALEPVRTSSGSSLLPSVVRMPRAGTVVVGANARRFLDKDPENTRGGFKRLLGTSTVFAFPAAQEEVSPERLSTEVLKALLAHASESRERSTAAVVTVPALFELPQTEATSRAAKAAGLERVELLQEPVASALAAGFRTDGGGSWLVYDLGGGTFDASLVVGEEGLLSIVGHDGDNFLGGRDFDAVMARLIAEQIEQTEGVLIDAKNPAHQLAWRKLLALAEEAKIELSRLERVVVCPDAPLAVGDRVLEFEATIERATFEAQLEPLIQRSIELCQRLLETHGRDRLDRVVLVGGPTAMPLVRAQVARSLGPIAAESLDPMTLVAQGAALYAAQRGLWCGGPTAAPVVAAESPTTRRITLRAPVVSTDLLPFVVGSVLEPEREPRVSQIRLVRDRADKAGGEPWTGPWEPVEADGAFTLSAELVPRRGNLFRLEAVASGGRAVTLDPGQFSILQGVTIGDPPVSRSIGVALSTGHVHVYLEKGHPLPARRTFTHRTVDTLVPGTGASLDIPLVQGEYEEVRFCRLIGTLRIEADKLKAVLPVGSTLEVALELDRGGRMVARAEVPGQKTGFEHIASLVVPEAEPAVLERECIRLLERLGGLHGAVEDEDQRILDALVREQLELEGLVDRALGGDQEAGQRARRAALDLEARLTELEARREWPERVDDTMSTALNHQHWVEEHGTAAERKMFEAAMDGLAKAVQRRSLRDLERHARTTRRLGHAAFLRDGQAYIRIFDALASRAHEASDLKKAERLVTQGRKFAAAGDNRAIMPVVEQLYELLPADAKVRKESYSSGLR